VDVIIDVEPALVTVPDVTHMSNTDARNKLESVGLEVGAITIITRAGATAAIDSQRPTGGSRVAAHSLIDLVEADAPIVRRAVVPNLKGKTQSDAERTLLADSLDVGTVVRSDDDSAAKITAQNPLFGDAVVFHSRVSFRLSNTGARDTLFIRVPPVKTLTIEKAERTLADSGFSHIRITGNSAAAAVVVDQSPRAGTLVPPGTLVSIAGELPEVHRVPKLTGRRELDARAEAERDGFYMLVLNQHRAFRWTEVVVSQTPGVGAPDRGDRRVDVDLDIPALPPVPTAIVLGIAGIAAVMIKFGRKPPHPKGNGFSVTDATPPPGLPTVASKGGDRLIRSSLEYDFSFEVDSPTLDIECRSDTLIQSEKVRNG
jgi:beta-lactam-binding protein with PASTA domain